MKVDEALVDHLAHLSRLQFAPAEKEAIRQDMEKIIGFVEKLNELDTTGVEPLRQMSVIENVTREDVVVNSLTQEEALSQAPMHDGQFFKVPKVIRK